MGLLKNWWGWLALFCVLTAVASARPLSEDDLFMQMRIGEEILKLHAVPTVDTFSYTIAGAPWVNYQWLSMVFFRVVYAIGGLAALVLTRSALTFILFFLYGAWINRLCKTTAARWFALLILLPLAYCILIFRIQLRPEYLGFILFVALLALWTLPYSWVKRTVASALLISLWSNLHGGTAVFGLALVGVFAWRENTLKQGLGTVALCAAGFLFTPVHFRVLTLLWTHYQYDIGVVFNSEYQGISLAHFSVVKAGWIILLWTGANLALLAFLVLRLSNGKFSLPTLKRSAPVLLFGVFLTALCIQRLRTIPYQFLLLTPLLVMLLDEIAPWILRQEKALQALAAVPLGIFFFSLSQEIPRIGFGLNEDMIPRRLFERVLHDQPKREMFSTFSSANYQLWSLRNYPVFVDPRDVLFDSVKPRYAQAFKDPESMRKLLAEYKVNVVLFEIPKFAIGNDGKPMNALREFFPKTDWALIDFSNRWILFYRRIPEHAKIIATAYNLLEPGLPPEVSISQTGVAAELARCTSTDPKNNFCKITSAGLDRYTAGHAGATRAVEILTALTADSTQIDNVDRYRALTELHTAYVTLGNSLGQFQTEQKLSQFTREDFMTRRLY